MKKILSLFLGFISTLAISSLAFAQTATASATISDKGYYALAAALAVGLAALGGTLGQSKAAASALEGIARNPGAASNVQTPMILGLALIESLVILAWVIAFMLVGKL